MGNVTPQISRLPAPLIGPAGNVTPQISRLPSGSGGLTFQAAIGWGVLFIIFIAMTDVPVTQNIALMLAILFLLSVTFKYGPAAFTTISTVNTTVAA